MKIIIVKAIIHWLYRRYPYLLREAVIPDGHHIHHNPTKKALKAAYMKAGE